MSTDVWSTVGFLAGVYITKFTINRHYETHRWKKVLLNIGALGTGLLIVFCYLEDWNAPDLEPAAHWIGGPLLYLTIPTISMVYDLFQKTAPVPKLFWTRSICEMCLFPVWKYLVVAMLDCFGWIYF